MIYAPYKAIFSLLDVICQGKEWSCNCCHPLASSKHAPGLCTTGTRSSKPGSSPSLALGQHCELRDSLHLKVRGTERTRGHCKPLCPDPVCFWLKQWCPCLSFIFTHIISKINYNKTFLKEQTDTISAPISKALVWKILTLNYWIFLQTP